MNPTVDQWRLKVEKRLAAYVYNERTEEKVHDQILFSQRATACRRALRVTRGMLDVRACTYALRRELKQPTLPEIRDHLAEVSNWLVAGGFFVLPAPKPIEPVKTPRAERLSLPPQEDTAPGYAGRKVANISVEERIVFERRYKVTCGCSAQFTISHTAIYLAIKRNAKFMSCPSNRCSLRPKKELTAHTA